MSSPNLMERVIDKLFSGSFSLLVMFGLTYCFVITCCIYLAFKGKIEPKDFLLIVGGLGTAVMAMWKDYLALKKDENIKINGDGNKGDQNEKVSTVGSDVVDGAGSASTTNPIN